MQRLTRLALRRPRATLAIWLAATVALSVAGIGVEKRLAQSNFVVAGTPSAAEFELQRSSFGSSISFAVLLRGPDAAVERQGRALARELAGRPHYDVLHPWQRGAHAQELLVGGGSLVVVSVDAPVERASDIKPLDVAESVQEAVDDAVSSPVLANVTGQATIGRGLQEASLEATMRAEMIAAPALIIILLLVFRSIVAALIPLVIGGATVSAGFGALSLTSALMPIDALATTFASMLGLALGVDYSLLLVSRFREEMDGGEADAGAAARAAAATAGHTVLSAGLLLMIGMGVAMAILPGGILFSAAVGSVLVTGLSLLTAVIVLPCLLQLLGPRVNKGAIRLPRRRREPRPADRLLTSRIAAFAFARPLAVGLTLLLALALVGSFSRDIRAITPNADLLPADSRELRDYREFTRLLGPGWGAPFRLTLRSDDGPITSGRALAEIGRFERELAREPGVAFVAGPGQLQQASRRLARVPARLSKLKKAVGGGRKSARRLTRALRAADAGAGDLESGLDRLSTGSDDLGAGAREARDGQARVTSGAGRAAAGSAKLQEGLGDVRAGASRLSGGLERVGDGLDELENGLAEVRRRLAGDRVEELARALDGSASAASQLREPAKSAQADLEAAIAGLKEMTVGKADPRYAGILTSVSRASAAVTGRNPVDGSRVRDGYDGLDESLRQLSAGLGGIAAAVRATGGEAAELRRGLDRLAAGVARVKAGVRSLEKGGGSLRDGARELAARTAELRDGLQQLEGGSTRVAAALSEVGSGADDLGSGLDRGSAGAQDLGGGIEKLRDGVGRSTARLPDEREIASIDAGAKGFFANPFAVLAAVDSGGADRRSAAGYVLSVRGGGEGARLVIIPETGVTDPRTEELRDRLQLAAEDLGRRTGLDAALGGEAAQVIDFQEATMSRLLLLMLVLAITNAFVLMVILRSLLLPLVAVALNLLTVAAAFGALRLLFQGENPLGGGPGYLDTLALTGTFTVIFALSIDYQLFLLARMREGYYATGSPERSVAHAITHTGGVILGAAAVMIAVFAAFGLGDFVTIRQLGVGLTVAIVLDATVVRLLILPAIVRLLGHRAWWFPGAAGRRRSPLPALADQGAAT